MQIYKKIVLLIINLLSIVFAQDGTRPFSNMKIYQEWECEEFLYDSKIQHWHDMIFKTKESRIITPHFFSAIDTIPMFIDGKEYYRYWPLLEDTLGYQSLIEAPPYILSFDSVEHEMHESGAFMDFKYYFIREEKDKILLYNPGFNLYRDWLESPLQEREKQPHFHSDAVTYAAEEVLYHKPENLAESNILTLFDSFDRMYLSKETGEQIFVFRGKGKSWKYNIVLKEVHFSQTRGIVEFVLYNHVLDRKPTPYERYTQECKCKIKDGD